MDAKTFGIGIKKLCAYYEKSIPPRETIELWLQKVERLPSECMPWMISQITESCERWPTNLPGAMLKLWPHWLRENRDKSSHHPENGCSECEKGILYVRDHEGYQYAFRCKCGQDQNALHPAWLSDLLCNGYTVNDLDECAKWRVPAKVKPGGIDWFESMEDLK